jgi:hypothetical protein
LILDGSKKSQTAPPLQQLRGVLVAISRGAHTVLPMDTLEKVVKKQSFEDQWLAYWMSIGLALLRLS